MSQTSANKTSADAATANAVPEGTDLVECNEPPMPYRSVHPVQ